MNIKDDPTRVAGEGELATDTPRHQRPVTDEDKELERQMADLVPGIHDMDPVPSNFTFLPADAIPDGTHDALISELYDAENNMKQFNLQHAQAINRAIQAIAYPVTTVRSEDEFCSHCKGSGESKGMAGAGPDTYEVDIQCPSCAGTGSAMVQLRRRCATYKGLLADCTEAMKAVVKPLEQYRAKSWADREDDLVKLKLAIFKVEKETP